MNKNNICKLCLVSKNELIEFYGDEGIKLNITQILVQHFWFKIHRDNDNLPTGICRMCWQYVKDFHEFYKDIKIIHENYYNNIQFINDLNKSNIKSEIIDSNSDNKLHSPSSFIDSNIESEVEIKAEQVKEAVLDKTTKRNAFKRTCNKNLKTLSKCSKAKTIKNDIRSIKRNSKPRDCQQKVKATKNLKKIPNKTLSKDTKRVVEQQPNENLILKNDYDHCDDNIINDTVSDEDTIINNSVNDDDDDDVNINDAENYEIKDNAWKENQEDIQIREFYNFKCEICLSQHSSLIEIKKHYLDEHNYKYGYVLCCNKKLYERHLLLEHLLWHTNPNDFKCKKCNKIYASKYGLNYHMNNIHLKPEDRKYNCDICGAGFTIKYYLMKHFRKIHLHQINNKFKCNQCEKSFNQNSVLQSHVRRVHELKDVNICEICAKVYTNRYQFKMHYLEEHVNANQPRLKCNLCGSMLKNESGLKSHIRRIHFDKPIECQLCNKMIQNKHSLNSHMRDAHSERKHKCNLCDKGFKRQIRLKEHMATHSGHSYLYTCTYCPTSFNSDANMYTHRKKQHPNEWFEDRQKRLGITLNK